MTETQPTFCGDLDVGTGDCDLMFLAEEPADSQMRERGGQREGERRKRGQIQISGVFSSTRQDDTA